MTGPTDLAKVVSQLGPLARRFEVWHALGRFEGRWALFRHDEPEPHLLGLDSAARGTEIKRMQWPLSRECNVLTTGGSFREADGTIVPMAGRMTVDPTTLSSGEWQLARDVDRK